MLENLFKAIDAKDTEAFAAFLAPACAFRFGNGPLTEGRPAIAQSVAAFFDAISALAHTVLETWQIPSGLACHGHVTYTRHDGSQLCVPFANVLKLADGGIREYLIFADTSQL